MNSDVLLKPSVSHNEIALISRSVSPRILNFVPQRLPSLRVEMNTRNNHSMSHGRFVRLQAIGLRKTQGNVERILRT